MFFFFKLKSLLDFLCYWIEKVDIIKQKVELEYETSCPTSIVYKKWVGVSSLYKE